MSFFCPSIAEYPFGSEAFTFFSIKFNLRYITIRTDRRHITKITIFTFIFRFNGIKTTFLDILGYSYYQRITEIAVIGHMKLPILHLPTIVLLLYSQSVFTHST